MAEPAKGQPKTGSMRIEPALVRELAQLLTDNQLTDIEVEDGDRRIRVSRTPAQVIASGGGQAAPAPVAAAPAAVAAPAAEAPAAEAIDGEMVKSPMVGTAFLSPEPGSKPFVTVGQSVKAGETLLIVEAMKVMNPITAPRAGVVKQLLVADAQPIEFDQPLAVLG